MKPQLVSIWLAIALFLPITFVNAQETHEEHLHNHMQDLREEIRLFKLFLAQVKSYGSCQQLYNAGITRSGTYYVKTGQVLVKTYCSFDNSSGFNWLVIQRRLNGRVDFYRNWKNYTNGFGDLQTEFWLGLKNIYALFGYGSHTLRIEMEDFENNTVYAEYSHFSIKGEDEDYMIKITGYSGDAGDSMTYHNFCPFSTYDRDNDQWSGNCAVERQSAWWFKMCSYANLNGRYYEGGVTTLQGTFWFKWKNSGYSLKRTEMKVRPN